MEKLKTNYTDDVLDTSVNLNRRYVFKDSTGRVMEENVEIEDVTEYLQEGETFGAADINKTNSVVNELNENLKNDYVFKTMTFSEALREICNNNYPKGCGSFKCRMTCIPYGAESGTGTYIIDAYKSNDGTVSGFIKQNLLNNAYQFYIGTGGADTVTPFKKDAILLGTLSANGSVSIADITNFDINKVMLVPYSNASCAVGGNDNSVGAYSAVGKYSRFFMGSVSVNGDVLNVTLPYIDLYFSTESYLGATVKSSARIPCKVYYV